jgi:hypothetical protein
MNINDCTDVFREHSSLYNQAQPAGGTHRQGTISVFALARLPGKGGAAYLDYPDISLYRQCMDVATVAFMLFSYSWQADRIAGLSPEDARGAHKALRTLLALAFLHDADKYRDQDGTPSSSHSPTLSDVQRV